MSYCSKDTWLSALETIADDYAASDMMPEDFADAIKRMVGIGLNRDEAETMLREETS